MNPLIRDFINKTPKSEFILGFFGIGLMAITAYLNPLDSYFKKRDREKKLEEFHQAGQEQHDYYYGPLTKAWFAIPKDVNGKPIHGYEFERFSQMAKIQNEKWKCYENLRIELNIPTTDPTF